MKLTELRRYLTKEKLSLQEEQRKRHLHFHLVLDGGLVPLPTILCIQHGAGEANRTNLKGVAKALGLSGPELKTSMGCRLSRACVLVKLAWSMLEWAREQFEDYLVSQDSKRGYLAMIESTLFILKHVNAEPGLCWCETEQEALRSILEGIPRFKCHLPEADRLLAEFSLVINR